MIVSGVLYRKALVVLGLPVLGHLGIDLGLRDHGPGGALAVPVLVGGDAVALHHGDQLFLGLTLLERQIHPLVTNCHVGLGCVLDLGVFWRIVVRAHGLLLLSLPWHLPSCARGHPTAGEVCVLRR